MSRLTVIAIFVAVALLAGGLGRASTFPGRADFCAPLERFAATEPLDQARLVRFVWPKEPRTAGGSSDVHFYAAMESEPLDDAARSLHAAYARATHYLPFAKLKKRFDACKSVKTGALKIEASMAACGGQDADQACLKIWRPARR